MLFPRQATASHGNPSRRASRGTSRPSSVACRCNRAQCNDSLSRLSHPCNSASRIGARCRRDTPAKPRHAGKVKSSSGNKPILSIRCNNRLSARPPASVLARKPACQPQNLYPRNASCPHRRHLGKSAIGTWHAISAAMLLGEPRHPPHRDTSPICLPAAIFLLCLSGDTTICRVGSSRATDTTPHRDTTRKRPHP